MVVGRLLWIGILLLVIGCGDESLESIELRPALDLAEVGDRVETFCGDCHGPPRPEHFPQEHWLSMVTEGFHFYYDSGRDDLTPPAVHEAIAYYRRQAPQRFEMPRYASDDRRAPIHFRSSPARIGAPTTSLFAVAFIDQLPLGGEAQLPLVLSDMRNGGVYIAELHSGATSMIQLENPACLESCDLDNDGFQDLVIADLGGFLPEDHLNGRVVWVPGSEDGLRDPVVLIEDIGRVADVQAADLDRDNDLDLIVAEFGWRTTGSLFVLINRGGTGSDLKLTRQSIDPRHGAIHVPPVDLDGDGRMDFVALISQEHEVVEAFLNTGPPGVGFERRMIFEANHPAFGASGIELVDLDQDGDTDVLLTNGDILDTTVVRPYQGIHWLENRGAYPFEHHTLTILPGAYRALAADLDNDGDLDIGAVALLPERLLSEADFGSMDSVIWLEQVGPGSFARHAVETGNSYHAALKLGDFDEDGDTDMAVGNFLLDRNIPGLPWVTIWNNQLITGEP